MLVHDLSWSEAGFETKAMADGSDRASFTGIASTADRDRARDIIEAGAFGSINPKKVRMFRDHMKEHLIGGWQKFEQDGRHLKVEGEISLLTDKGRETYALMKQGFLDGLSVGFQIQPGGAVWDNTKQVRTIKRASLIECSIVALPANEGATVSTVKSLSREQTRDWLHDNGWTDRDVEAVLIKGFGEHRRIDITEIDGYKASDGRDSDDDKSLTALAAELKALLHVVKERHLP
jgi:uncharacterized protein